MSASEHAARVMRPLERMRRESNLASTQYELNGAFISLAALLALAEQADRMREALELSECHNTVGEWAIELECKDDPDREGDLCHRCAALAVLPVAGREGERT